MTPTTAATDSHRLIHRERMAFERQLAALLDSHEGEFILFKDGRPCCFFPTFGEAYREGLRRFGLDAVFLVTRVENPTPPPHTVAIKVEPWPITERRNGG